jgi:hypothetical protein
VGFGREPYISKLKLFAVPLAGALMFGAQATCAKKERRMPSETIQTVLQRHTDSLMSLPGVVGTAIGECAGQPCIRVFVVKKTSPLVKKIPAMLEGFRVEIEETGAIRALDSP